MNSAEIDRQIKKDVIENHIPGMAVIVVDKDNTLFTGLYGDCHSAEQPFIIGSMSKSFTALAIMQLVEANKVELDAPIKIILMCPIGLLTRKMALGLQLEIC